MRSSRTFIRSAGGYVRDQHLLSECQRGRNCFWSGSKSDRGNYKRDQKACKTAGDHEAQPECDGHHRDGKSGRSRRCRCVVPDGISLTGMKINIRNRKFALANKTGGMSGPAVHPIAVRMVYQVAQAVNLPIIGMGGVHTAEDAIEMMLAGATAVAVGTANFQNPRATMEILEGIRSYMAEYEISDIRELIGAVSE